MKQKEMLKYIKNIINSFNNEYNYILDYKLKCGTGYCEDFYIENKTIHIGCRELKGIFNKDLDELYFTKILINIFHESRHAYQQKCFYLTINSNFTQEDINMFINYLACSGGFNGYYKNSPRNYYSNPRELDAEKEGINKAYNYLSTLYGNLKAEEMLLNYINNKIDTQYYINIRNPFSNLNEVYKEFDKAFLKSYTNKRYYNTNCIEEDVAVSYCQTLNDNFIMFVNDENNPLEQDKILAGAYNKYLEDKCAENDIKQAYLYNKNKKELSAIINKYLEINKETDYNEELD